MELNQEEKDRIIAEEKLRMETRKDYVKEHFEGPGCCGRRWGWHGHGCHRHGFWGFMRLLVILLVLGAVFHWWHFGGACQTNQPTGQVQAPPASQAPAPAKN